MIKALIDGLSFDVKAENGGFEVNGKPTEPEIIRLSPYQYHVILQGRSHSILIHKIDPDRKEVRLSINGKKKTVEIKTRMDQLLKQLGMENSLEKKLEVLKAPMPGLVQKYLVKEGDQVEKGDSLLILEAMKMENVIKSPGAGTVSKLEVAEHASVEKNAVLIRFS